MAVLNIIFVIFPIFPLLELLDFSANIDDYSNAAKDVGNILTSGCLLDLEGADVSTAVSKY